MVKKSSSSSGGSHAAAASAQSAAATGGLSSACATSPSQGAPAPTAPSLWRSRLRSIRDSHGFAPCHKWHRRIVVPKVLTVTATATTSTATPSPAAISKQLLEDENNDSKPFIFERLVTQQKTEEDVHSAPQIVFSRRQSLENFALIGPPTSLDERTLHSSGNVAMPPPAAAASTQQQQQQQFVVVLGTPSVPQVVRSLRVRFPSERSGRLAHAIAHEVARYCDLQRELRLQRQPQ